MLQDEPRKLRLYIYHYLMLIQHISLLESLSRAVEAPFMRGGKPEPLIEVAYRVFGSI